MARRILSPRRFMLSLSDLALSLNVNYWLIKFAIQSGKLPTPPKVGSIWVFDKKMIKKVKAYFSNRECKA